VGVIYIIRRPKFMTFISQNELNTIRSNVSIVDVISSYVPLTQKGKNFFGVCPFHEDHSPSMSVSEEKQIYKCFSCGATGNVFTFVENYLNVSFAEAAIILAEKAGLALHWDLPTKREVKYQEEYDLMDLALRFYQNNLQTEEGEKARDYLKERGLLEDTIKEFSIGLSLSNHLFYTLFSKKGYKDSLLQDLGLIAKSGEQVYDVFQNRIMFPIHDLEGHVVGFTARCYLFDMTPKYLNTRETYLFKKGSILFNYHRAKETIRIHKQVIVVEGNMDAIRLSSVGIKNVVALMGTSLTREQMEAFKKLRSQVILMLDNDTAGETATFQVGNLLEENSIPFSVVRLSGEKDPDAYVLKNGAAAILENVKNAISFLDFKLNYLKKNKNLQDASDLADYIKAVLQSLKNNSDTILKEVTLQKLANDYNISYAVLKEQLGNEEVTKKVVFKEKSQEVKKMKSTYEKLCEEILYYMMHDVVFIKLYQTKLGIFPTKEHRLIANEILYYYETNKSIQLADFITYAETTTMYTSIMDILSSIEEKELTGSAMLELIRRLKKKMKEQEIEKLKMELKKELDENKKTTLALKIVEIKGSVSDEDY